MGVAQKDLVRSSILWPGVPFALFSALLFGASVPLSKQLLQAIDPFALAGLLYLGSGVGLAVFVVIRKLTKRKADGSLSRADLPWLTGAVLFGGVFGPMLLMLGLRHTPATEASLLLNLESLATMGVAWIVFRENVDRRVFIGAMTILAGAIVLSWQGRFSLHWGFIAIAGACLCWGIDNNLTRKISGADPVMIACIKGLVASPINLMLGLTIGAALPGPWNIGAAAALGLVTYGVSLVLFILALRHLGTARTGAYYGTAPFMGALLSFMVLSEPITWQLLVAGSLMATGVWLHLSEVHEHTHFHAEIEHEHRHVHDEHHQHAHDGDEPPGEPHSHWHHHPELSHRHAHYPDLHHRHDH